MAGLDTSVFDKIQTVDDYNKQNSDFLQKKMAAQQALQTGQIAQANAANVYATQLISAAAATGDQNQYNNALNTLKGSGIDTSTWAPDVASAQKQAMAGRLAQSPLGSLLNSGLKVDANNIAMGGLTGQVPQLNGVTSLLGGSVNGSPLSGVTPGANTGAVAPQPAAQPAISGSVDIGTPGAPQSTPTPQPTPAGTPALPAALPGQPVTSNIPKFVPPPRDPSQTLAAYQQQYQQALEAYKNDPTVIAGQKSVEAAAAKQGDAIGDASKTLNIMQSNLPQVLQRFDRMRNASDQSSYGYGVNQEGSGFAQQFAQTALGNDQTARANSILQQAAAQGILPELGPQLAQAGIRGNKFLETLATSASGLDLSAKPEVKKELIDNLEGTYINNLKSTSAQLRANGQNAPTSDEIDQAVKQYKDALSGSPAPAQQPAAVPVQSQPAQVAPQAAGPQTGSEKAAALLDAKVAQIPGQAAAALKQNPALAQQFDGKYGPGMANYILSQ